jgi:hypothetical protein
VLALAGRSIFPDVTSMRFRGAWLLALVAFAAALAMPHAAEARVKVSFYSHTWGMSGAGYLYFPHAFIVAEPDGPSVSLSSRQSFGFTPVDPAVVFRSGS